MRQINRLLFPQEVLAAYRAAPGPYGSPERERAFQALREGAAAQAGGDPPADTLLAIDLGLAALDYEAGNWPAWGDPAAIGPYLSAAARAAIGGINAGQEVVVPAFARALGLRNAHEVRRVPSDVWEIILGLAEHFDSEPLPAAVLALGTSPNGHHCVSEPAAAAYVRLRNGGVGVEQAAEISQIALVEGSEASLAVLERMTEAGQLAMRGAALTHARFHNLGLGAFRELEAQRMPEYAQAIAIAEMMSMGELPEPGRAFAAAPLPWPHERVGRALYALQGLRAHLILAQLMPRAAGAPPEEVAAPPPVGTVEEVAADEPEPPPPPPPPPPVGPAEGAVVELLDDEGRVIDEPPPPPPPPPPEPRFLSGREMAEMGPAPALDNMLRLIARGAARGTAISGERTEIVCDLQAVCDWCATRCVDAVVRMAPSRIRGAEPDAEFDRFVCNLIGSLLLADQGGHAGRRIGMQGGRSLRTARFPLLATRANGEAPERSVGVWALKILEAGARLGGPMLAFASETTLAEMGEEDPGGFMGRLAQLGAVARALEPPAVASSKKLEALKKFFHNN